MSRAVGLPVSNPSKSSDQTYPSFRSASLKSKDKGISGEPVSPSYVMARVSFAAID